MRAHRPAIVATLLVFGVGAAVAEPQAAAGFRLETVTVPGALFSGLARDGDDLLVANLADGRLYRKAPGGELEAFGPTLPHGIDVIGDPTGPYRVVRRGETFLVAQGWTPAGVEAGPNDHALIEVDEEGNSRVLSSAFWNPFDFAISDAAIFVVDAARNSIERLDEAGARTTVFGFARLAVAGSVMQTLSPTQFKADQTYEFDAVPTGIDIRDDRLYVSLFGGFPFISGAGRVVSIPKTGGELQIDASGLDAPVDIAWNDGTLLILEHGTYDQSGGFVEGSGRLSAFDDMHGSTSILLDGLTRPSSVLLWDDDEIVISDLGGHLYFLTADE